MKKAENTKCAVFGSIDGQLEFGGIFDSEKEAADFIVERMGEQYADYFEPEEHDGMTLEDYIDSFFTNKTDGNILNEWFDSDYEDYFNMWQIVQI